MKQSMTQRTPILLLSCIAATSAFSLSEDAFAGGYSGTELCGTTSSPAPGGCYAGYSVTGSDGIQQVVKNSSFGAMLGQDLGSGPGMYGTSNTGYAGYFESTSGTAVYGTSSGDGVSGKSTGNDGVYGLATSSGHSGVHGQSTNSGGYGVKGENDSGGYGVWGVSSTSYAGYFDSSSGTALYGTSSGDGVSGNSTGNDGVYGLSSASAFSGVHGQSTSTTGYGVKGEADSGGYGVYGVGTTGSGNYAGYFSGAVKVTGELTVGSCPSCSSDIRLKQNVKTVSGALDRLLQLKGVTFEWKNPAEHEDHTGTQTGFIAQDVEKIFPEWVKQDGYTGPDGTKYRTLDTRQIEALEVESIRTLKAENDQLKAKLVEQDARLNALEAGHPRSVAGGWGGAGVGAFGLALGFVAWSSRKRRDGTST